MLRLTPLLLFFFAFLLSNNNLMAQGTNSPYSRIGIGDILRPQTVISSSMGGIGISMGSLSNVNLMNPALLPHNRYTSFEAAGYGERKNLATPSTSQKDFGGNLGYMVLQMPVSRFSSMAIGLQPYSLVKYETASFSRIENSPSFVRHNYTGAGGITQAFLSYGSKIWKELYLGARINYNFGASRNTSQALIFDSVDPTGEYIIEVVDRINYSDFSFQGGAQYRIMFDQKKTKSLNFGMTYDVSANLNAKSYRSFSRKTLSGSSVTEDTIYSEKAEIVHIPAGVGLGISYQKALHYGIAAEVFMQNWGTYRRNDVGLDNLGQMLKVSLGGEWVPNVASVDSYLERITYRGGISYTKMPVLINGKNMTDMNVNLGLNMPFGRYFSTFNFAVSGGMRQSEDASALKENYIRFHIGATINDRWFVRRRYE